MTGFNLGEIKDVKMPEGLESSPLGKMYGEGKLESIITDLDAPISQTFDSVEKLKTDDNGKTYYENDELLPNNEYVLNGNEYKTDDHGRIIEVKAKPKLTPENSRDTDAQREAGGEDRRSGDQGSHIVGRDQGGDGGPGNIVAMDSSVNQSDYKKMENHIKNEIEAGKDVTTETKIYYSGDSKRPDRIDVRVTADGETTIYKYDNNLDNSLMNEIPETIKDTVQETINDTGGSISSIKEVYDADGNLVECKVTVTYKDENGKNQRINVTGKFGGES